MAVAAQPPPDQQSGSAGSRTLNAYKSRDILNRAECDARQNNPLTTPSTVRMLQHELFMIGILLCLSHHAAPARSDVHAARSDQWLHPNLWGKFYRRPGQGASLADKTYEVWAFLGVSKVCDGRFKPKS
jgi:hypothetical protein